MELFLRSSYSAAGNFIESLGVWTAVLSAGLLPIYVYLLASMVLHKRPIAPSRLGLFLFATSVVVSSLWSAVLLSSAMVLGQWC